MPQFYSTTNVLCTSDYDSLCSNTNIALTQGSSYTINYKIKNNGTYILSGCNIKYTDDLENNDWISSSLSNFSISGLSSSDLSLTLKPIISTPAGTYYSYIYVFCEDGDSLGDSVETSPENRIFVKITINPTGGGGSTGGGGGGSRTTIINNTNTNICGNHICEPDSGEDYLTCPEDCTGKFDTSEIKSCFSNDPEERKSCVFTKNKAWIWILVFITGIFLFTLFFELRNKRQKRNYYYSPTTTLIRKRRR